MKIMIVGSGGREHALAWSIKKSSLCDELFCLPGNGGTAELAKNMAIGSEEINNIVSFAKNNRIDLAVIGPEAPLVLGLSDALQEKGVKVFGPNKLAAQMEGSKSFAKGIMFKYGVPTGAADTFESYEQALHYVKEQAFPLVIKADGLAAGKGVVIVNTITEAEEILSDCFLDQKFGPAGNKVLIEEFLSGPEVSLLCFVDGKNYLPMTPAQDHKAIYDGDKGPNTGGMGCYSPVPLLADSVYQEIIETVVEPTIWGLQGEEIDYQGVLYFGIMLTENGPKVLEFNARFGDPETQVVLPRLNTDIVELMLATANRELGAASIGWKKEVCISVVLASGGYPGDYKTGIEISGTSEASKQENVLVFHAGTKLEAGKVLTAGGRVLNVTALADDFTKAREKAYQAIKLINFDGMYYRQDIGQRAVQQQIKV
ncbi:MAG: phosphoribosylamine--glycine ligase [Actinobacteria bacterium]|nr:MAG: phosphoribosylamine--glycine ligase [Actinomycetota bacterium]